MNQPKGELKRIALADIVPSASNPRKHFETADWPDFVENIRQRGVLQPGVGRLHPSKKGKIELVAGERRYRASTAAKLEEMPLMIMDLTDADVTEIQQIENLQREGLSALEEAQGYADWRDSLIKAGTVKTVEEAVAHICTKINRKRSAVFQRLALLKISDPAKKALTAGEIDASKAGLLALIPDLKMQAKCLKEFNDEEMTYREARDHVEEEYRRPLKNAPFKLDEVFAAPKDCTALRTADHKLLVCSKCPLNTSNMVEQYPDLKSTPNVCTNPACYQVKIQMNTDRVLNQALSAKRKVIAPDKYQEREYDFTKPDRSCYQDSKNRNYGQLAKVAGILPAVTVDEDGKVVEVFTDEDVRAIKAANKIRESYSSSGVDRAKAKRTKENLKVAYAAAGVVVKKFITPKGIEPKVWRLLADGVAGMLGIERETFIAKRRGLAEKLQEVRDGLEGWLTGSPKDPRTTEDLQGFILEAVLLASWKNYSGDFTDTFKDACKLAGGTPQELAKKAAGERLDAAAKDHMAMVRSLGETRKPHTWEKTDLVSGATTNYRCKVCGVKGVRMGITWPPRVAKKDEFCRAVTSNTPPQKKSDKENDG